MPASTCTFVNGRGQQLSCRLEEPAGPVRASAIFAHCFTCSKDMKAARRITRALADRGVVVLSLDFAGLGSSDGEFAESTFAHDVDDVVAASAWLEGEVVAPTLLVGHSLGGAAVLMAASRLPSVRAVATVGAPADIEHVATVIDASDRDRIREQGEADVSIAGRSFRVGQEFIDDLSDHRLLDTVSQLDAAVLLLHGPLDNTVGIDHARDLFQAARHPKSYVSLDDADHLLSNEADAVYAANVISAWASRYLPAAGSADEPSSAMIHAGDAGTYQDRKVVAVVREGFASDIAARGFTLRADEPAKVGGTETGPTPYDYLGAALAACTSMTLRMYADRRDLPLDEVTTTVDFHRVHADDCVKCDSSDSRIGLFEVEVHLRGDLSDEDREKLLDVARRCPVHRTLLGAIEVHTELVDD